MKFVPAWNPVFENEEEATNLSFDADLNRGKRFSQHACDAESDFGSKRRQKLPIPLIPPQLNISKDAITHTNRKTSEVKFNSHLCVITTKRYHYDVWEFDSQN